MKLFRRKKVTGTLAASIAVLSNVVLSIVVLSIIVLSIIVLSIAGLSIVVPSMSISALAAGNSTVLPSAGIDYTLGDHVASLKDLREETKSQFWPVSGPNNNDKNAASPSPSVTAAPLAYIEKTNVEKSNIEKSNIEKTEAEEINKEVKIEEIKIEEIKIEETKAASLEKPIKKKEKELAAKREEEGFKNLVIAQVNHYVNVRSVPSETGEILGKLYDKSVGTFISEIDGWYEIRSGSVTGYVKGEYCVTGEQAIELAKKVGTRIATVATTTLKVREQPGTDTTVLGLVPIADELLVTEELDGWVKVNIEEGDGYISAEYITLSTEFVQAESREEEAKRLAKEEADRRAAQAAAAAKAAKNKVSSKKTLEAVVYAGGGGSALGSEVVNYACKFVGNPYQFGGSSLTSGTDCSGFVMSVYRNFGVGLPHSSSADRGVGTAVDGLANAQPGDIICYSGHVGIYVGNGNIVHASTKRTGIIVSSATYRSILSIRRIF